MKLQIDLNIFFEQLNLSKEKDFKKIIDLFNGIIIENRLKMFLITEKRNLHLLNLSLEEVQYITLKILIDLFNLNKKFNIKIGGPSFALCSCQHEPISSYNTDKNILLHFISYKPGKSKLKLLKSIEKSLNAHRSCCSDISMEVLWTIDY